MAPTKGRATSHVSLLNGFSALIIPVSHDPGKSKTPTAASFVRPTRSAEQSQSFVAALQDKYTGEVSAASAQIKFSGKIAEEVGFQKIQRQQANLAELKFVILDGSRIAHAYAEGDQRIATTCPKTTELDLSRNLFTKLETVVDICSELPALRNLRIKYVHNCPSLPFLHLEPTS